MMGTQELRGKDRRDTDAPHRPFGRVLEAARESSGLNRNVLAGAADVAYSMLYNVERGRRRASDAFIKKVAPKIGLRPDRMIAVRNALEVDRKFPLGRSSELQNFMVGQEGTSASAGTLERRLGAVLEDRIETLFADAHRAYAADHGQTDDTHAGRPRLEGLARDLPRLSDDELSRVQGYVDRLLEERAPRAAIKRPGATTRRPKRPPRSPGEASVDNA